VLLVLVGFTLISAIQRLNCSQDFLAQTTRNFLVANNASTNAENFIPFNISA